MAPDIDPAWSRRLRELDRWADKHATIDLKDLDSGYHSAEIWFRWPQPWPVEVRRQVVQRLIEVHDRWAVQLQALKEPSYLGVWLFEPALTESQLVAAVGDRAIDYAARHDPALRVAPPGLYQCQPVDLSRFEWTRHAWQEQDAPADDTRDHWLARIPA